MHRWWVLDEETLLDALRAAAAGEDPEMIMAGLLANSELVTEEPVAEE